MEQAGRILIVAGLTATLLGGLVLLLAKVAPNFKPGRLPGDIAIQRDGFSFFFPITTMILFSALLTLIIWGVQALRR